MKATLQKQKTVLNYILICFVFFAGLFIPVLNAQVTQTFSYTGSLQTFTVPSCVVSITIDARGAQGGGSFNGAGGLGARMVGTYTTTAGTVYTIVVGQMGLLQSGGNAQNSSGGGGGSFVYTSASNLLVAAGGGGGKCNYTSSTALHAGAAGTVSTAGNQASSSGALGGTGGLGGNPGIWSSSSASGGGAGWLGAGGGGTHGGLSFPNWTGGAGYCSGGGGGCGGVGGYGGGGGGGNLYGGGGGGGGYSGGGGGTDPTHGGGGGSFSSGTNQSNTSGYQTGDGLVIITYNFNGNGVTAAATPSFICNGSSANLSASGQTSYTWSTGSNAASIVVSPNTTTSYTVQGTNSMNCVTNSVLTVVVNTVAPTLTVTASTNSICLGNTVSIAASGALSYTFSGGISNNVSFTPVATSTYVVQGQNGCGTSSTAVTITVSALPVVAITSTNVVCAGSTATLSAGGATTYSWQPGNLVGASVIVAPQNNTTYTVLGFTGACGGINTVSVSTNPVPSLTVTVSHFTLCAGESSTITATGASSYTWTPGGLGSSIVVNPLIPTSYIVVGENSFGCTSSAQQGVVAYAGPNMNIAASSTLICAGGVVTLNSSGATTYLWNTGATTAITTATPASTTVYTVVGSAPGNPCSTTKTIEINVFTATISVSSPTAICLGESTTLTASGANTYNWSNGGSGSSINVNPSSTTVYTVTGTSSAGGSTCLSTAVTQVTVNPLPTVGAASTRTSICRFESTTINGTGALSYSWSTSSTATSIVVSPTIQTTYTVLGTDVNGCKNTGSILIRVSTCPGFAELSNTASNITVYPNPSSGEFMISAKENMSLVLINELGQLVQEIELNAGNAYTLEIKGLSKGVYFINSKNAELQFNKKIVVQ